MNDTPWWVVLRKSEYVLAKFSTESNARQYARERNREQHTNRWMVINKGVA